MSKIMLNGVNPSSVENNQSDCETNSDTINDFSQYSDKGNKRPFAKEVLKTTFNTDLQTNIPVITVDKNNVTQKITNDTLHLNHVNSDSDCVSEEEDDSKFEIIKKKTIRKIISRTTSINGVEKENEVQEFLIRDSHINDMFDSRRKEDASNLKSSGRASHRIVKKNVSEGGLKSNVTGLKPRRYSDENDHSKRDLDRISDDCEEINTISLDKLDYTEPLSFISTDELIENLPIKVNYGKNEDEFKETKPEGLEIKEDNIKNKREININNLNQDQSHSKLFKKYSKNDNEVKDVDKIKDKDPYGKEECLGEFPNESIQKERNLGFYEEREDLHSNIYENKDEEDGSKEKEKNIILYSKSEISKKYNSGRNNREKDERNIDKQKKKSPSNYQQKSNEWKSYRTSSEERSDSDEEDIIEVKNNKNFKEPLKVSKNQSLYRDFSSNDEDDSKEDDERKLSLISRNTKGNDRETIQSINNEESIHYYEQRKKNSQDQNYLENKNLHGLTSDRTLNDFAKKKKKSTQKMNCDENDHDYENVTAATKGTTCLNSLYPYKTINRENYSNKKYRENINYNEDILLFEEDLKPNVKFIEVTKKQNEDRTTLIKQMENAPTKDKYLYPRRPSSEMLYMKIKYDEGVKDHIIIKKLNNNKKLKEGEQIHKSPNFNKIYSKELLENGRDKEDKRFYKAKDYGKVKDNELSRRKDFKLERSNYSFDPQYENTGKEEYDMKHMKWVDPLKSSHLKYDMNNVGIKNYKPKEAKGVGPVDPRITINPQTKESNSKHDHPKYKSKTPLINDIKEYIIRGNKNDSLKPARYPSTSLLNSSYNRKSLHKIIDLKSFNAKSEEDIIRYIPWSSEPKNALNNSKINSSKFQELTGSYKPLHNNKNNSKILRNYNSLDGINIMQDNISSRDNEVYSQVSNILERVDYLGKTLNESTHFGAHHCPEYAAHFYTHCCDTQGCCDNNYQKENNCNIITMPKYDCFLKKKAFKIPESRFNPRNADYSKDARKSGSVMTSEKKAHSFLEKRIMNLEKRLYNLKKDLKEFKTLEKKSSSESEVNVKFQCRNIERQLHLLNESITQIRGAS